MLFWLFSGWLALPLLCFAFGRQWCDRRRERLMFDPSGLSEDDDHWSDGHQWVGGRDLYGEWSGDYY